VKVQTSPVITPLGVTSSTRQKYVVLVRSTPGVKAAAACVAARLPGLLVASTLKTAFDGSPSRK
jgi:hypothetical protein